MSALAYLGIAVGLSLIGLVALSLARRRPRSMQSGMETFSRELRALAPPDAKAARLETHVEHVQPAPLRARVGHSRPRPNSDGAGERGDTPESDRRSIRPEG